MQEIMEFKNGEFENGIQCYEQDGTAYLNLDAVARGLGFTQVKNGVEYVRWERVNGYLAELGFCPLLGKDSYIPENIFYRLAMKAKNATAEKFQAWIADEVIPSNRKHGGYMISGKFSNAQTDSSALTYMQTAYAEKQKMIIKLEKKDMIIQSKAEYYDKVLDSKNSFNVTQIAKDYGMSAKSMNKLLEKLRVQYLTDKQWVLYQDYANKGYTKSKTFYDGNGNAHMHTRWTQKGRLFIYEILKANDVIPLNEVQNAGAYDSVDDKI